MHRFEPGPKGFIPRIGRPKLITSKDNPVYKLARALATRKGRDKNNLFLVEGMKLVLEALAHPELVETVLISESGGESLADSLGAYEVPLVILADELAESLAETATTQGVWAVCHRPDWGQLKAAVDSYDFLLVLAGIQDPGNLGTMLRTAWAVGVEAVLLGVGSVDPFNSKVIRSAMGATLNMPVFPGCTPEDVEALRGGGFRVIACDPQGEMGLFQSHLNGKLVLVMGNEGQGLLPGWKAVADSRLSIPLQPGVDSLNVAVACGIVLYEAYRQRNGP